MEIAGLMIVLAVLSVGGTVLAERMRVPAPMLLILIGVAGSFVPFLADVQLSSELVLVGLLPPLLYSTAIQTSLIDVRANAASVGSLSVALVVVTTLGVAAVLHALVPDLGWPLALATGAVVAPPDAVAATAVARRIGLPRSVVTILEAESLLNDATALVALRTAVAAIAGGVGIARIGVDFALAAGGGVLVGLLVFVVVGRLRRRVTDALVDNAISLLTPFVAYLLAEEVEASGVIAVVVSGFLLAHKSPLLQTAASRITERVTWRTVAFVLENAVFLLLGLQVRQVVTEAGGTDLGPTRIAGVCAAALAAVVGIRLVWVLGTEWVRNRRRRGPAHLPVADRVVIGWAGMRGVVTVAAALVIPVDAPYRDVLVLVALTVVLGTLFLQGTTLPWLARRLRVRGPDPAADALARATLLQQAAEAGLERLEATEVDESSGVCEMIRSRVEQRSFAAWERLSTAVGHESPSELYARLRLDMLAAERGRVLEIRDEGTVPSDIVREVLAMLDIEESMIDSGAEARGDVEAPVLVGAGEGCGELRGYPVPVPAPEPATECPRCVAEGTHAVALRRCLVCGEVACCDSSPARHADAHFRATGHPVMMSAEPGEHWRWCYLHHVSA